MIFIEVCNERHLMMMMCEGSNHISRSLQMEVPVGPTFFGEPGDPHVPDGVVEQVQCKNYEIVIINHD